MYKNNLEIITLKKPGITDFAEERNRLLKKSKAEWIFFSDSDEDISDELRREIEEEITDTVNNGFYVYRKNYFLGKFIGTDRVLRVGKRGKGKWFRRVHEVWNIKGPVETLKNSLIHNTANSLYEYIGKINKYARMHSNANKTEGKQSNLFKIIIYPKLKFIESILTGRGTVFSILQAFHSFLSWSTLWLSQRKSV